MPPKQQNDDEPVVIEEEESFDQAHARRERAAADREEYNRDIAKIERDQLRGKLVTSKEAKAAAAEVRDAFLAVGKQLWSRVDGNLDDRFAASDRQQFAGALNRAWADLLAELSL